MSAYKKFVMMASRSLEKGESFPTMVRTRILPALIVVVAVAVIAGIGFTFLSKGEELPIVYAAPDFTLPNISGEPVPFSKETGTVRVVEFLFANCPDICPTTTATLVQVQNKLKEKGVFGDKVEFYAITFDPARDTPDVLSKYAEGLQMDRNGWELLRGTEEDTFKVLDDFGVFAEKQADGTFVHSTGSLFLVDEDNNIRNIYQMGEELLPTVVYDDIMSLVDEFKLF